MTVLDTVNRVFREFKRYTGDGLANEPTGAPLPIGDPQSGPNSPKKSELRAAFIDILRASEDMLDALLERYLGAYADDAAATAAAGTPITGQLYFNTTDGKFRVWNATTWQDQSTALGDGEVTETKHATGGVSSRALAALSVITAKIANAAVTLAKLGADVIAEFSKVDPNGPRSAIGYYSATAVQIRGENEFAMGGFRFHGRYKKGRVPVFSGPAFADDYARYIVRAGGGEHPTPDLDNDLGAEGYAADDTWYAVFAVANDGDATCQFKLMPFLRMLDKQEGTSSGWVRFNAAGEHDMTAIGKVHDFTTDGLVETDVLIITENDTVRAQEHAWSGRLTTVTANAQNQINLADNGNLEALDWFLVAPPGWDHYRYLGCFYYEDGQGTAIGEVRNIADTGTLVKATMDGIIDTSAMPNSSGGGYTLGTVTRVETGGYISPLATAIVVQPSSIFNAGATSGVTYEYWGMDAGHIMFTDEFDFNAGRFWRSGHIVLPFSWGPQFYYTYDGDSGDLKNLRSSFLCQVRGWIEP